MTRKEKRLKELRIIARERKWPRQKLKSIRGRLLQMDDEEADTLMRRVRRMD